MSDSSLRYTTVLHAHDLEKSGAEYIRGFNTRSEIRDGSGVLRVHIRNRDLGYLFVLEPEAHTYVALRVDKNGSLVWMRPKKAEPMKRSGRTVHNYLETIDTGDRRQLFGHMARRVVQKTRQIRDSETLSEAECDGWYIDPPEAWANLHPPPKAGSYGYIILGNRPRDDYKFYEEGRRENGFVMISTRTTKSSFTDQSGNINIHESIHRHEVTDFSEAQLERDYLCRQLAISG